jgi:hypothetical protein
MITFLKWLTFLSSGGEDLKNFFSTESVGSLYPAMVQVGLILERLWFLAYFPYLQNKNESKVIT